MQRHTCLVATAENGEGFEVDAVKREHDVQMCRCVASTTQFVLGKDIVRIPDAAKVLNICYCCSSVVSVRISRAMQGGLIDLMGESIPLVDELHKGIPVVQHTHTSHLDKGFPCTVEPLY